MLNKETLAEIIANGENSSVEFKQDDIRPEQLAKEIVAMANFQGGMILLGVDDQGSITGIHQPNLEEWIMDTVIGRHVHPIIIPHYQEIRLDNGKRVEVISISPGTAKPYVLRHNDREDIYIRMGSTSRLATREQIIRLLDAGGLLHTETLPVSGTSLKSLDMARLENYLSDILGENELPASEAEWQERLDGLGFMTTDAIGNKVCTIAGITLFGIRPRRFLKQAGLRVMAFDSVDKQYQALLDVILDGPMVGRWSFDGEKNLIDEGIIEKFIHTIEPFITVGDETIAPDTLTRGKKWLYTEATEDYLKTILPAGIAPENAPEKRKKPLKRGQKQGSGAPENSFQRQILELIRGNPKITYDILAKKTGRDRKTVRRHIAALKEKGLLRRIGPAKGGYWEIIGP